MSFHFKTIEELGDINGKKAIVLVDLNENFSNGVFEDDFRIEKAVKTISFLLDRGARVLIVSHFGSDEDLSLLPVSDYLNNFFPTVFARTVEVAREELSKDTTNAVLLENIRMFKGERENDDKLSKNLASLGDFFVNEGFSVSHREHSSVVGVPKFLPSYAGLNFKEEINNFSLVFNPPRPFILVLAGKKTETKLPLIKNFIGSVDKIFVGGVLANDFLKAKGFEIGDSLCSSNDLIEKGWLESGKIVLPDDFVVTFGDKVVEGVLRDKIRPGEKIVDVGQSFALKIKESLRPEGLVVWNGSMGMFENGFKNGTRNVAEVILESGAKSIVGGGDTVSAIKKLNMVNSFSFVSTGGGAMLDFLCDGKLPGIDSLVENAKKFN
jgi:3-phosphoglycerate kinase